MRQNVKWKWRWLTYPGIILSVTLTNSFESYNPMRCLQWTFPFKDEKLQYKKYNRIQFCYEMGGNPYLSLRGIPTCLQNFSWFYSLRSWRDSVGRNGLSQKSLRWSSSLHGSLKGFSPRNIHVNTPSADSDRIAQD